MNEQTKQPRKNEKPLSLHPLSLEEAIKKIAPIKRKKPVKPPKDQPKTALRLPVTCPK